ncbi:MAG: aldehyde dehydrogenase family protein, partial [bacterium]|nr:aldehyde dehydrogenase family protein [bacterium]
MDSLEQNIRLLVQDVLSKMDVPAEAPSPKAPAPAAQTEALGPGLFADIETAIAAAKIAQQELLKLTLVDRKRIIEAMRKATLDNNELMSNLAVEDTGFGRVEDKLVKHKLVAEKTPGIEDLVPLAYSNDDGMALVERAPWGVIGAIIPSTNPSSTVICNGIGMIAGGNSVVFGPHPFAKKISGTAVSLMNQAIVSAGGPMNLLTALANPTVAAANVLMTHEDIAMLVVTGGPAIVKLAMGSGKKAIAAGPGNPPCVVDETADIEKAGKDIVAGGSFDNNIICICEKEVIVVDSVADRLKQAMCDNGAYLLDEAQTRAVTELVITDPGGPGKEGMPNKDFVGKNASVIAKAIGLEIPDSVRMLLCEVGREHPLIWTEQLMPVMPLTRVKNVDDAIELAFQCEHGFRHTAMMHSLN